jgi:CDP-4-dehydro-6-deoxyglucose reductase
LKARLISSREVAPNTRHFEFEAIDWDCRFVPGQFVSLTQKIAGNSITRAYSIASPPNGSRFALCANLVPEGHFSPFLFGLDIGGEIEFKGPYGAFILRRPVADSLFVATGTGIAPFRSIIHRGLREHPDRHFTLIFGVRYEQTLLYNDEWVSLAGSEPNFSYAPTLTRPSPSWGGLTGRVHDHVISALGDRRDIDVYICGLREMVNELRTRLKALGLDRKRTIFERYD